MIAVPNALLVIAHESHHSEAMCGVFARLGARRTRYLGGCGRTCQPRSWPPGAVWDGRDSGFDSKQLRIRGFIMSNPWEHCYYSQFLSSSRLRVYSLRRLLLFLAESVARMRKHISQIDVHPRQVMLAEQQAPLSLGHPEPIQDVVDRDLSFKDPTMEGLHYPDISGHLLSENSSRRICRDLRIRHSLQKRRRR